MFLTYLVQQTVWRIRHNADDALLAGIARGQRNLRLAKVAQAALLDNGEDLLPARLGGAVESHTEQPSDLVVGGAHGQRVAADVEVDKLLGARGDIGREAAAGRGALLVVVEADGVGVVHEEVRRGDGGEGEDGGEDGGDTHFGGGGIGVEKRWSCESEVGEE